MKTLEPQSASTATATATSQLALRATCNVR